ncbi:protein O-glucosyltransferase 1-like [Juglans microcarpa x Juglans regia]|uniref:protein O-glucosyltransferase 1-like n=1 Tax=Juglans microcarpa x Juglans regia TaxID=2249226 RepID=UPI001B7F5190|nr:protein O-glucosyltransferase 1-like [Juglans microcarpa x Juglans regia]
MGLSPKNTARTPSYLLPGVSALAAFSITALLLYKVDDFASQTKTVAGHNLDPTPWHLFPAKTFGEQTRQARGYKIIHCSYLACHSGTSTIPEQPRAHPSKPSEKCPDFFRWIHHDLKPWARTGISISHLAEAQKFAAFRVVIIAGKLYVDLYYTCVQSRMMFTIWGLLQLLKRYPGKVPDVDMMFDCMDRPRINMTEHKSMPLPLFRYCTTEDHFDIPFPDWSFWGWPETNLRAWDEEFRDIKRGSQRISWSKKWPRAYWKGNPDVQSPVRIELLKCNHSRMWEAQIMRQDWAEEARIGYEQSKLSNQCNYQYKIYAEGYAWSVSLKYILSCGSLALIISPDYEDFFSRGLIPKKNYWPVSPNNLCPSIKYAVDWGTKHPSEAKEIGKEGQKLMETLSMDRVYDYMFHLITEYSKLQDFKPVPPYSAQELCPESLLCIADIKQRQFLEQSTTFPSQAPPCTLQPSNSNLIKSWIQRKKKFVEDVENMEKMKTEGRSNKDAWL